MYSIQKHGLIFLLFGLIYRCRAWGLLTTWNTHPFPQQPQVCHCPCSSAHMACGLAWMHTVSPNNCSCVTAYNPLPMNPQLFSDLILKGMAFPKFWLQVVFFYLQDDRCLLLPWIPGLLAILSFVSLLVAYVFAHTLQFKDSVCFCSNLNSYTVPRILNKNGYIVEVY